MNRKLYEAVPVEEWKKKSSMKEVPGLDSNGDINMVTYFPDYGTFYFVETDKEIGTKTNNGSNIITHVLVAVEEVDKWISPERINELIETLLSEVATEKQVLDNKKDYHPEDVIQARGIYEGTLACINHIKRLLPSAPKQEQNG